MKFNLRKTLKVTLSVIILFSFTACHNLFNNDDPEPTNEYLVSYENVKSYLPTFVEQLFGQLTNQYPDLTSIQDKIEHGIMIYRIKYNTTFQDNPKVASGLVCIPLGDGTFPVLSYQNGTNTLHDNAPSVNPDNELYVMLEFIASTGLVVVIPDYLGFGSSDNMFHPYLHKESTVQSVLDMLRAVKELTENYLDTDLNNDLYLSGYSQGGWATMAVQKTIEQNFSGEFNLRASACGAGPYDLVFMNEYIIGQETYPMPYFAGYMFNSYSNLGIATTPSDSLFNEPYAEKIPVLYNGTKTGEEINEELTTDVSELFTANYLENYQTDTTFTSLLGAMATNSISAWNTNTPTRIYHGSEDNFVPATVSSAIYEDFEAEGASQVELILLPGLGHTSGIVPTGLASIQWFLEQME